MTTSVSDDGLLSDFDFLSANHARTRGRTAAPALLVISTGFASTPHRDQLPIAYFAGLETPDHQPMFDVLVLSMRDGPFDMDMMTDYRVELIRLAAHDRPVVMIGNSGGSAMNALKAAKGHRSGAINVAYSVHISGVVPDARRHASALERTLAVVGDLPERTLADLVADAAHADDILYEVISHGHVQSLSSAARFILSRFRGANVNYPGISEDASHITRYARADLRNAVEAVSFCSERRITNALRCLGEMGIPTLYIRGMKDLISTRSAWNAQRRASPYQGIVTALEMPGNSHDVFRFHDFRMQLLWHVVAEHLSETLGLVAGNPTLYDMVVSETGFRSRIHELQAQPHVARRLMDELGIEGYPPNFGREPGEENRLWDSMRARAIDLAQRVTARGDRGGLEPAFGLAVAGNG